VCLLILLSRVCANAPLVVAANRDERFDRPAEPMTLLRERNPRMIGGRDLHAGGTWLAVNEHGVVAAITNHPTAAGPDPTKRSRGELPVVCATQATATDAVAALAETIRPTDYNPAWLFVADRTDAFAVGIDAEHEPVVRSIGPGIHVLENRPFGAPSPKVDHIRALLNGVRTSNLDNAVTALRTVLSNHDVPGGPAAAAEAGRTDIPLEVGAACVHTERYGTRWSAIVTMPTVGYPTMSYAAGAPCRHPFVPALTLFCTTQPRTRATRPITGTCRTT
jgi:uncharacterized protein with NRDE domain